MYKFWMAVVIVLLVAAVVVIIAGTPPKPAKVVVAPPVQTASAASAANSGPNTGVPSPTPAEAGAPTLDERIALVQSKIDAVISKGLKDECPGIANTLKGLRRRLENKQASLVVAELATGKEIAFTTWVNGVPNLIFPLPIIEKLMLSSTKVDNTTYEMMCGIICHEAMHMELAPANVASVKFESLEGQRLYHDGEAAVWAKQIVEITRPMMKAGRYVDGQSSIAALNFERCGSENNAQWKSYVTQYLCVTNL